MPEVNFPAATYSDKATPGEAHAPGTHVEPTSKAGVAPEPSRTPLVATQEVVQAQYLAAQDREDVARKALQDAEDHHASCTAELDLLEAAHKALFPEELNQPAVVDPPVASRR